MNAILNVSPFCLASNIKVHTWQLLLRRKEKEKGKAPGGWHPQTQPQGRSHSFPAATSHKTQRSVNINKEKLIVYQAAGSFVSAMSLWQKDRKQHPDRLTDGPDLLQQVCVSLFFMLTISEWQRRWMTTRHRQDCAEDLQDRQRRTLPVRDFEVKFLLHPAAVCARHPATTEARTEGSTRIHVTVYYICHAVWMACAGFHTVTTRGRQSTWNAYFAATKTSPQMNTWTKINHQSHRIHD